MVDNYFQCVKMLEEAFFYIKEGLLCVGVKKKYGNGIKKQDG